MGNRGKKRAKKVVNRSEADQLLIALRHPMRREALRVMDGKEAISPRDVAEMLGEPLSSVSYHMRVLADCKAIVLVKTQPIRGAMKHFYRARIEAEWARNALGLDSS